VDKKIHEMMHAREAGLAGAGRAIEREREGSASSSAKAGMRAALRAASAKRGHAFRADHSFITIQHRGGRGRSCTAGGRRQDRIGVGYAPLQGDQTASPTRSR